MVDLAKEQMITQAAVTGIVDHLVGLGFVKRTRSKLDRRVVVISITRKGRDEVKEGIRLYKKFIEKATGGLTAVETRTLLAILDRMLEAAEKAER
jgi:DNA-binding MarR family transcriptional regulator